MWDFFFHEWLGFQGVSLYLRGDRWWDICVHNRDKKRPAESYKKILAILAEVEDHKETKIFSQSEEFKKLVKKGLDDVKLDRIKPWKEVWNEL